MRHWEEIIPEADRLLCQKIGWGEREPLGDKPALLIIDVTWSFVGSKPMPIMEGTDEYPLSCGEAGWAAVGNIKKLLNACRAQKIPVIFTHGDPATGRFISTGGLKRTKPSKDTDTPARRKGNEIVDAIAPLPSELVISKTGANALHGTPLESCLHSIGINCLLVAGCVTSGCVRATVVEARAYGYPCFVVEECVFDRWELSHLVSLFDMNAKYATVITLEETLSYVTGMPIKAEIMK